MKTFLCIERGGRLPDEKFTVRAKDLAAAKQKAAMWGAEVIREIKTPKRKRARR